MSGKAGKPSGGAVRPNSYRMSAAMRAIRSSCMDTSVSAFEMTHFPC